MKSENNPLAKHRSKRASEGFRYVQVHLDPEALQILDQLKIKLRIKRKNSKIFRKALFLLYEQVVKDK